MKQEYEAVSLDRLNGGQVVALFDRELEVVLRNIADENTPSKAIRSITIQIDIKPEEDRESAVIQVSAKSKLAAVKPSKSFAVFGFDGKKVTAYQTDVKQLKLGEEPMPENVRSIADAAGRN